MGTSRNLRPLRAIKFSAVAAGLLLLSACADERYKPSNGWLPSTKDMTNQTGKIMNLWEGSWIAALAIGCLVWGLTIWCIVVYRRRKHETGVPAQIRYHLPIEILYTIVPLIAVGNLFYFTARDQAEIQDISAKPDYTVNVVAKQWAWDFNYLGTDPKDTSDDVYSTSAQVPLNGKPVPEAEIPTLYLPVNKRIEFVLNARDVIHSFWVPAFLYKLDMIPGLTNRFQVVPQVPGLYEGKCAELCGQYHSQMLFNVKVVPQAEYDKYIEGLRAAGQTGTLPVSLGRNGMITNEKTSEGNK